MANTSRKQSKYEELELIKAELSEKTRKLRVELSDAEEALRAVALAIRVWKNKGAVAASKVELNPHLREFRGLTQVQALVKIAKDSGTNRFKLREAKKVLLEAGLVKSKKNAATILFTAIQRSEKFKRVAPGEYELILKPIPSLTPSSLPEQYEAAKKRLQSA
jgi:hypothetical protein